MTNLQRRSLGATGLSVAPVGLAGSWGITADEVERAYHELGVNYFFVTPRMSGLVEGIRRLVDAGHRDDIVIAAGATIPTGGRVIAAHAKLSKLFGVETIDVFHLFWIQAQWYVTGKTWPAMRELKSSGRARSLAISIHDRKMARRLVDELDLDVLMCRYNAAHRGAEGEIFDDLPEQRPGIVAYTATRWGRLLKSAGDLGPMTPPECYQFVLSHPRVDVVLCGASNFAELSANVAAVQEGPLEDVRMEAVRRFGDRVRATATGRIGFMGA